MEKVNKNEYEDQKILVLKTKTKFTLIDATDYTIALVFICMGGFDEPEHCGFYVWQGNITEWVVNDQHHKQAFFDDIEGVGEFIPATETDLDEFGVIIPSLTLK